MPYILCLLVILAACQSTGDASQSQKARLLRECPDEWIINRQPRIVQPGEQGKAEEYYILRGKRVEKTAFDLDWVQRNCRLEPTVVQ